MEEYGGRPIKKRVVNLGIGGAIDTPADLLDAEPQSVVSFTADADLGAVKHKFEDDGSVTEQIILTVKGATFTVVGVEDPPPIPEQGTLAEGADDAGPED